MDSTDFDAALGTIGAGNHFAELQMIERIYCRGSFKALGLDKLSFYLLVHSGSRGMGASLLRRHTERFGAGGLVAGSEEALQAYKNIDAVINDMQRAGLIRVVATLLLKGAQAAGGVIYPNMSEDWDAMPTRFRNTLRRR